MENNEEIKSNLNFNQSGFIIKSFGFQFGFDFIMEVHAFIKIRSVIVILR